jgi:putative transposase
MCKVFKVSKSAYYQSIHYLSSDRNNENRAITFEIWRIFEQSKDTYGSPRITRELKARGYKVSRPRVARLMKQNKIRAIQKKKYVVTTDSKHNYPVVENKLDRNFSTSREAEVLVSDITYIRTLQGWLYLTIIIDLYSRKVVGWALSTDMSAENTTMAAWKMAILNINIQQSILFHSDRGIQYACQDFVKVLECHPNITRSMSRKGNCWDNAVAESFFKTIKTELIYRYRFTSQKQAALAVFEWIETWYNRDRRHSAIGNLTIREFEQLTMIKNVA